jgi:hypothetical protein
VDVRFEGRAGDGRPGHAGYTAYLGPGRDPATRQQVGLLTRLEPLAPLRWRSR